MRVAAYNYVIFVCSKLIKHIIGRKLNATPSNSTTGKELRHMHSCIDLVMVVDYHTT